LWPSIKKKAADEKKEGRREGEQIRRGKNESSAHGSIGETKEKKKSFWKRKPS